MSMPMLARKSAANKLRIASTLKKEENVSLGGNYAQLQLLQHTVILCKILQQFRYKQTGRSSQGGLSY
jgi:hypothetical protein